MSDSSQLIDTEDILEDISLESDNIESSNDEKEEIIETKKLKKDTPTPDEINQMSDDEIVEQAEKSDDEEVNGLYNEFMGILDTRDKIVADNAQKIFCPTGINILDAALGGGFVIGGLTILVGSPGCGKSMVAMQTMAQAQRKLKDCCMVVYIDSEESTTTKRLSMLGVNNPKIKPITQLTLEKVFKVIDNLCKFKEEKKLEKHPAIIVWDSIANTLTEKEFEVDDPNSAIGYKARFLTHFLPQYIKKCSQYNIGLIAINQLRDSIQMGPYSAPRDLKFLSSHKTMPGGNSLKFNAFHLMEMKVKSSLDPSKYSFDGIEVVTKCVKNKAFRPNIEVKMIGNFNRGFSNFWTNYAFLAETKRMKTGAWNYLVNCPTEKFRTKDAPMKYNDSILFRQAFDKEVEDAIKCEILEKYNNESVEAGFDI